MLKFATSGYEYAILVYFILKDYKHVETHTLIDINQLNKQLFLYFYSTNFVEAEMIDA